MQSPRVPGKSWNSRVAENLNRQSGFFYWMRMKKKMTRMVEKMMRISSRILMILGLPIFYGSAFAASNTGLIPVSATVSGVSSLNVILIKTSDDQPSLKMQFANTNGVTMSDQYVRIEFDSNALGARIIIRSDNQNSNKPFTGIGEGAGLVGNTDSTKNVPLLWAVFPDLASAKGFVFKGDTDPSGTSKGSLPGSVERGAGEAEGLVVDKRNANFETHDVLNYATVVLPNGPNALLGNFPTDEDGAGPKTGLRSTTSPVFLVLGADFVNAISQVYSTNTLGFDLIVQ